MERSWLPARLAALVLLPVLALLLVNRDGSASQAEITIFPAGPRQTVFDWSEQACEPDQVPDLPARAFRDDQGRVQLLLSHFDDFRMRGPSLSRLRVDCRPVMSSPGDPRPSAYADRRWIASLYTEDGQHVWALVHDEYQGNLHRGRCPMRRYQPCWYNAVTLARSTDRGRSYRQPPAPRSLVAVPAYRYRPGFGPAGVFAPSNVVRRDDYLYALVRVRDPGRIRGDCLIRARSMAPARAWRAWDGEAFAGVFADPYGEAPRPRTDCAILAPGQIAEMTESLTFDRASGSYVLLGMAPPAEGSTGLRRTGIYYSTSSDLVHWSERRLLLAAPTVHSFRCGGPSPIAYPTLIDPSSRSRTFATIGSRPYLYFTQFRYSHCRRTQERDLIRMRVRVSS